MKTPGMTIVGAWTSPVMISAAKPATAVMQTTRLPPTTAARRRAIGIATAPERDGGIDDERDKEHVGDLGHDHPRIGDADRTRNDGASPQRHLVQRRKPRES